MKQIYFKSPFIVPETFNTLIFPPATSKAALTLLTSFLFTARTNLLVLAVFTKNGICEGGFEEKFGKLAPSADH